MSFQDFDLYVDRFELEQLGLTEEEIEGYFSFFAENFGSFMEADDVRIN